MILILPLNLTKFDAFELPAGQVDKPRCVCGTLAVGTAKKEGNGDVLLERIVSTTYGLCRSNPGCGIIPDFPDFAPLLAEMDSTAVSVEAKASECYQVTALQPDGALVIKEQFFQQFGEGENEIREFHDVVKQHDETFNASGVRLSSETQPAPAEPQNEKVVPVNPDAEMTAETLASLDVSIPQLVLEA